ncbi:MAG: hypothetical protein CMJ48_05310 [Planctomycetaceae bacterium]|nr:hypothetical protein [Planctomycetaceae bacterium]
MNHVRLAIIAGAVLTPLGSRVEAQTLSATLRAEGAASLAKAALEKGDAVRGAILFPQQKPGCANCHSTGPQNLLGPDLTRMGDEATPAYLVEAMLYPSKVIKKGFESSTVATVAGKVHSGRIVEQTPDKLVLRDSSPERPLIVLARDEIDEIAAIKTSAMPDDLVDQLANRQQFLDLLKYMMELKAAGPTLETTLAHAPGGGALDEPLQGLVLMGDFNCLACHEHDSAKTPVPPKRAPNLAWGSGRIDPNYIERFLADPLHVKPGTTMPDVMGTLSPDARRTAAREITHYVVSLGEATFRTQPLDATAAKSGGELFHSVGCVACHSPRDEERAERLPKDSVPLGRLEGKYNLDGLVAFLEDPHAARPSGRMPNMQLSHWEAIDIAQYLLGGFKKRTSPAPPFQPDAALAEKGKLRFSELGCGRCHEDAEPRPESRLPALTGANSDKGCLSRETGKWPSYSLDQSQRRAIRGAIARAPTEFTDQQQIALTLSAFRCVACHQRGELGGVAPQRNEFFQTTDPNLGPQGRIPPPLSGVGAKLKPKWMRQVLVAGRTIRPYMKTRMPQYGTTNVEHLVDLFQHVDRLPDVEIENVSDPKETRKIGHELAGTNGLNCIACHTFQQKRAATMPAVDLTEMVERLQTNWFYHYMREPQRFSANTIMPSFWPGGRAMRKDVLDGDADRQMQALWQYLLDGRQARAPRGLIREPIELVATDEAVMLRRNYNGIGRRGIGVGYSSEVNLAFDAEQMRLAMIWKGKFADPGAAWHGQGSGTVRPLGTNLIRFARGPELDDAANSWLADDGRPPQHRFRGYFLDDMRRPTFMYRFDNIEVEDYPIDAHDKASGEVRIRRTLTFTSQQGRKSVSFRAAVGEKIVAEGDGTFRVDDSLRIRIGGEHTAEILETPAGKQARDPMKQPRVPMKQLRVPMDVPKGKSSLILDYSW